MKCNGWVIIGCICKCECWCVGGCGVCNIVDLLVGVIVGYVVDIGSWLCNGEV